METTELIQALRRWAIVGENGRMATALVQDLNAAADRLEELDERVAIMSEGEQVTMEELVKGGEE